MQAYFRLQLVMVNRKIREFGMAPFWAWLLLPLLFTGLSLLLFSKSGYAAPAYAAVALLVVLRFNDSSKNDFLLLCYGDRRMKQIRVAENLGAAFPFIAFLLFRQEWYTAAALSVSGAMLALVKGKAVLNYTLPTPFAAWPFEFTSGFRSSFLMFPFAYMLVVLAVMADNFNLGIFSILLIFLVSCGFYLKPEPAYFVWIFNCSPAVFLIRKMRTALFNSLILTAPVIMVLGVAYPGNIPLMLLFLTLGEVFLLTFILAKYAAYPMEINLPEFLILTLGMVFLPAMLLVIPYFYIKAIKKLREFLV